MESKIYVDELLLAELKYLLKKHGMDKKITDLPKEENIIQHPLPKEATIKYSVGEDNFVSTIKNRYQGDGEILYLVDNGIDKFIIDEKQVLGVVSIPLNALKKDIKTDKPPLGIIPKKHHERLVNTQRFNELCSAISRYYDAGLKINIEWVEEYNELIDKV